MAFWGLAIRRSMTKFSIKAKTFPIMDASVALMQQFILKKIKILKNLLFQPFDLSLQIKFIAITGGLFQFFNFTINSSL